jgi:hypothetical protein
VLQAVFRQLLVATRPVDPRGLLAALAATLGPRFDGRSQQCSAELLLLLAQHLRVHGSSNPLAPLAGMQLVNTFTTTGDYQNMVDFVVLPVDIRWVWGGAFGGAVPGLCSNGCTCLCGARCGACQCVSLPCTGASG